MPPPFSADVVDTLSLDETDERYAQKAGSSEQSFDCNKLSCHYVSTQSGVDFPPPSDAHDNITPLVRLGVETLDQGDSGMGPEYAGAFTVSTDLLSGNLTERLKVTQNGAIAFSGDSGSTGQVLTSRGAYSAPQWTAIPVETQYLSTSNSAVANSAVDEHLFNTYVPLSMVPSLRPHTMIAGLLVNWMANVSSFVRWSGAFVPGGNPSILCPVSLKPKRLTMRYYGASQASLTGGTTCTVTLCKYTEAHAINSQNPSATVTVVSDVFTFNNTNAGSGYPAVNVDLSTLNSGAPYELAQNETLMLRFQRSIANGHEPSSDVKNAEIQCCLYAELGS